MKIKEIEIHKNFTKFKDNQKIVFNNLKSNVAFIYGVNGSGKSSISRLLYYSSLKLKNNEEFKNKIEQLNTIGASETAKITIYFDNNLQCIIDNNDILNPVIFPVFNKDYIDSKITYQQNFRKNKFDPKNSTYSITSEAKNNYIDKVKEYDFLIEQGKTLKQIIEEQISLEISHIISDCGTTKGNSVFKEYSYDNFKNIDTAKITGDLDKIRLEHIQFIQNLKDLSENDKISFNIELLKNQAFFLEYINKINEIIKFSEDKTKISFAKEYLDKFELNEKKWKLEGEKYITNSSCPFCGSDISNNNLIELYKTYINSKIKQTEDFIHNTLIELNDNLSLLGNLDTVKQKVERLDRLFNEKNSEKLNKFVSLYHDFIKNLISILNSKLEENNLYIDCTGKIDIIDNAIVQNVINNYADLIKSFEVINKKIDNSNKERKLRNESYLKTTAKYIVYRKIEEKIKEIHNLYIKIENTNKELKIFKTLYEEDIKNKNELLNLMNEFLDSFKITNYRINEEFDLCINKIPVVYKANQYLSDGEKSIIAFALFLAEIQLLYTSNEKDIIFIDDPITSLDYPNIYNVYNYICDLIKSNNSSQIIITSHNIKFLNMFKRNFKNSQYILLKENEFGKTINLDDTSKLSSDYLEKLKEIYKVYITNNVDNSQKLYIHNYCRYVIETISRFEFPDHNEESDSSKHYTDLLINKIKEDKIQFNQISKNEINSFYNLINRGSHATIDIVHDDEEYIDSDYTNCCKLIIKYLQVSYIGQYNYLCENYKKEKTMNNKLTTINFNENVNVQKDLIKT